MATRRNTSSPPESKVEEKVVREIFAVIRITSDRLDILLEKFAYSKLLRVSAWIARFVRNARSSKKDRQMGPLSTAEIEEQEIFWVKQAQQGAEATDNYERDRLQLNLQPNDKGVLECRGRIQGQYSVYVPDCHPLSSKIVTETHLQSLQGGISLTMARVREQFWVPRLRRLAKKTIK